MGDIVNKNDRCCKPENDNYSSQYSSTEKSVSDFLKPVERIKKDSTSLTKYSSRESKSSDKMHITTSHFKNYNNKIKKSRICKKTSINNRENIKSQLCSSTPIFNSEHSVNGITVRIRKRIEQLQKHLVKSSAGKLSMKELKKYEKDYNSYTNQRELKPDSNKEVVLNISEESVNKPSIVHFLPIRSTKRNTFKANLKKGYKGQNERYVTNQSIVLPATNDSENSSDDNIKLSYESEIDKLDLKRSTISINDSDDQSSSDDDNYTKFNHNVSKELNTLPDSIDENLNLDNSVNVYSSTLISKNRKTFQSNDEKDYKNPIKNKVVKICSTISPTMLGSESICSGNIIQPVKNLGHRKHVNHEPKITKLDLTKSEISIISDSEDQSSSDDDNYTKHSLSKQDDEKLNLDNSVNVHSSTLISKNRKTFQWNDEKDYKTPIKNKVVKICSTISPTMPGSESICSENIIQPVKNLDQRKHVNYEPKITKFDLTKSEISIISDSEDQSSSDDDNYTKHSLSKQDNEKLNLDNSVNVHSSTLSSKKRKTFQSNDENDCKNHNENIVVKKHSPISPKTFDSESTFSENIILPEKYLDQRKNINHEPDSDKLGLTGSKICRIDSDNQISSDDAIYTKLKHSISKPNNKKLKLDNSANVHYSNFITKKKKTFQSNDKKDCKNQIKNMVVTKHSSSTSNSESSSNENIKQPVEDLDQKKNVNHESEITKLNLTESKISIISDSEDQNSSDDDNYTKLKKSLSKQDDENPDSDDEKLKLDNSVIVHCSTLSSKKRKTFQSNDKNDCKNKNGNKVVKKHSPISPKTSHSESILNENIILPENYVDQRKKLNHEPDSDKLGLTGSKISKIDSDDQSSSDDTIYTKLKHSISKPDNEKFKLDNSTNVHYSNLITQKKITFQSNDKNDSESSSNENMKQPVKDLDQRRNLNHESEINKHDLTESKISILTDSEDQSSSNDAMYLIPKHDASKQVDRNPYTTNKSYNKVNYLNGVNDSLSNIVHNEYPPSSKLINSNTKKHCFNMAETDTNKMNEFSVKKTQKKNKKQKSKKCTLLKSLKDNKSLNNLMKITNNKDKLINAILEEECSISCSSSSVSTDNDNEFIKEYVGKQRLNKINSAEVPEVLTKNNTSNKQTKTIKKSDDKITKPQNKTFVTTDKLSNFILDAHSPSSKLMNSYTKEHLINVAEIDKNKINKLSNEKTPKNTKKQGNKKGTPLKSSKDNKSIRNLMKITNNKDKLIKKILEEESSSVSTDDFIEFIKKNVEKQRLNNIKKTKVPEISIKNNTTNKQFKTIKKPQITTDDLSSRNIKTIKRKGSEELPKNLLLDSILNSLQDSSSCHSPTKKKRKVHNLMIKTNDISAHINYDKSSSKVKKKKTILNKDVTTDGLASENILKTSKEITNNLLLDRVANSLQNSSCCHSPTKKKRIVHNLMVKTNDLSKVEKKKKNKHSRDITNLNDLIVKDDINQIKDSLDKLKNQNLLVQEKNSSIALEKKKHVKSDSIQCDTDITNNDKLGKINNKRVDTNLEYTNIKSNKKQSKIFTTEQIKKIISIQDTNLINNLDNMYRSLNT